jgi:hypothetical protein
MPPPRGNWKVTLSPLNRCPALISEEKSARTRSRPRKYINYISFLVLVLAQQEN